MGKENENDELNMEVSRNEKVDELVCVSKETKEKIDEILKDLKFSYDLSKKQFTSTIECKFFGSCTIMTGKCICLYGNRNVIAPYFVIGHIYYLINHHCVGSDEKYLRIFLQNYVNRNRLWIDKVDEDRAFEKVNEILIGIGMYYRIAENMCDVEMIYFQDANVKPIIISPFHLDHFKEPEVFALLKTLSYLNIKCGDDKHEQNLNNLHSRQIIKTVVHFIDKLYIDKEEE